MASAGAGKTATLLAAVSLIDCSVLVLAFGKRNADELNKALPALSVTARSFNSAGLNVWTSNPRHTRNVFQSKTAMLLAGLLPPVPCAGRLVPHRLAKYRAFAKKAVALAKCDLLGVDGPDNEGAWQTLFARHRAQLCRLLPRGGGDAAELAEGLALASEALKRSRDACFHKIDSTNDHVRDNTPCIDFDDQVYMPLWCLAHLPNHGMSVSQRDFVVVDEAQDMNPARTELMLKLMAPCGRCLVVGDTRQTIYGFNGSTSNGSAYFFLSPRLLLSTCTDASSPRGAGFSSGEAGRPPGRARRLRAAPPVRVVALPESGGGRRARPARGARGARHHHRAAGCVVAVSIPFCLRFAAMFCSNHLRR